MLRKLKRKITMISVSLVGIVLASVLLTLCVSTYSNQMYLAKKNLSVALNGSQSIFGDFYSSVNDDIFGSNEIHGRNASATTYCISKTVNISVINNSLSLTEDELLKASEKILKSHNNFGSLHSQNLYFEKINTPTQTNVALIDSVPYKRTFTRTFFASGILFITGLFFIYIISMLLSSFAVKPVQTAWEQQQQFVADASHELKTPLTVILANNNIVMSHENDTVASQKKWLSSTKKEADHMNKLINDLLFLSRSDAGNDNTVVFSELDFSEICESTLLQFEPVAFEKNIILNSDIESDLFVHGDKTQLNQLTHILLDNACKYTPAEGYVFMHLCKNGADIELEVNNTGSVIPSYELPHLFERFYRSDKSRSKTDTDSPGGYGLGLAIAKTITEKHHGSISAISSTENGTTFKVVLRS